MSESAATHRRMLRARDAMDREVRKAIGLTNGDTVHVTLTLDTTPRTVDLPDDFAAALDADPRARAFFDGLSNSLQRYQVGNVTGTKNPQNTPTTYRQSDRPVPRRQAAIAPNCTLR